MGRLKIILSFFLLGVYSFVLLHSVIPHVHCEDVHDTTSHFDHSTGHHHHDHHHDQALPDHASHDHHEDHDGSALHSLGHLLFGLFHGASGEEHLSDETRVKSTPRTNFKEVFHLLAFAFQPIVEQPNRPVFPHFSGPPLALAIKNTVSLRGPPACS